MAEARRGPKKSERAGKPRGEATAAEKAKAEAKSAAKPKRGAPKSQQPKSAEKKAAPQAEKKGAKPEAKAPAKPKEGAAKPKAAPKSGPKAAPARPRVHARARYVRVAPRKARLIADQIRGLPIEDARSQLAFSNRGAARDLARLLESAAANAETNHELVADDMRIAEITVNEGPTLRRYRARALGRATRINKRTSHIDLALEPEE